jgi:hypothetical protein
MANAQDMRVLTPVGVQVVAVMPGSEAASVIGSHWNAIKLFRDTGESKPLERFKDPVIGGEKQKDGSVKGGYRLATDPKMIKKWAKQGELDIDDPYEPLGGDE